jgi:four helix bundle protein
MDYAVGVYEFAATLPPEEEYNLASQRRRAATSAPLNIAEGCGSASNTEFSRFLRFAYRSLKEVVTAWNCVSDSIHRSSVIVCSL